MPRCIARPTLHVPPHIPPHIRSRNRTDLRRGRRWRKEPAPNADVLCSTQNHGTCILCVCFMKPRTVLPVLNNARLRASTSFTALPQPPDPCLLSSPTHALFLSVSFFCLPPFSNNMRATTPPRLMMFCLADRWALMALTGTSLAQTVL